MKRVCKRKVMIDALTVCFEVENHYHFDRISSLDFGETYDLYEFQLVRIIIHIGNGIYIIIIPSLDTD